METPAMPMETPVQMDGVTRRFNGVTAVRDLSLTVRSGTILGLIGPSGSGKTTTVKMLVGTLQPTDGEIRVLGQDPVRFSRTLREQLAYMPQLFSLYPDLSVRENVGFVAALFGFSAFNRRGPIHQALELVHLWDKRDRLARDLSGGEQRRLELACAVVHEPTVLFVDEPTAGIDPMLRLEIWEELRQIADEGRTLLVTTQYVSEAEYCDEVAILVDGELVARDTPDELRRGTYGGEILEVDTDRPVDPNMLANLSDVISVQQPSAQRLIVVVEAAGTSSPRLMEALAENGANVTRMAEYQPSFDEIFSELVERRHKEQDTESAEEGDAGEAAAGESGRAG
jgi:ABC-2 type transport system ATP-binding protein